MITLAILIAGCKTVFMTTQKEIKLKIIETTDVHGAIFPKDLINQKISEGSLAQVYTYVTEQREDKSQEVILIDNGDILQGTPLVYYYNFEVPDSIHLLSKVMNFMAYDVATIGNHDIEAGHPVYDKFRKEVNFDILAANAINDFDEKPYFKPYKIIERQGVKIAILGLITPAIPNWLPRNIWSGMHFNDMIESAKYWKNYIEENEKPDLLIGLFHSGTNPSYGGADPKAKFNENACLLVAEKVPGFDIIFAGHDHQFANFFIRNSNGDSTLILNPSAHATNVGVADICMKYDKVKKKYNVDIKGSIQPMEAIKPDSLFQYKFNVSLYNVEKYVNRPIGKLQNNIDSKDALFGSSEFVDLVHIVQLNLSKADISFASPFSISVKIDSGQLYVRDMFKLYRYENFLYTMRLTGQEVKDALEYSYGNWLSTMADEKSSILLCKRDSLGQDILSSNGKVNLENPFYNFDSGAGIIYEVDIRKEVGKRISILSMADGSAFDLKKDYSVAMNSYRGNGGGNILTKGAGISSEELSKRLIVSSDLDFRFLIMKWIEEQKSFKANKLNSWKIVPENWAQKGKEKYLFGL